MCVFCTKMIAIIDNDIYRLSSNGETADRGNESKDLSLAADE